jgi:hypothetical protein
MRWDGAGIMTPQPSHHPVFLLPDSSSNLLSASQLPTALFPHIVQLVFSSFLQIKKSNTTNC